MIELPERFKFRLRIPAIFNFNPKDSISGLELLRLSLANMRTRKARTIITVGGMMIGISAIVFLVSIGYGLQELVVSRVARLEELRQINVTIQQGSSLKITDETVASFNGINGVERSLPLISLVGKVNYQDSNSDVAVYGVTTEFLRRSAVQPVRGELFVSDDLSLPPEENEGEEGETGEVLGMTTSGYRYGEELREIEFTWHADTWVTVREGPSRGAKVMGYTRRSGVGDIATEVWGGEYETEDGSSKQQWLKAKVALWDRQPCSIEEADCEEGRYLLTRGVGGEQTRKVGFFGENYVLLKSAFEDSSRGGQVLGIRSDEDGELVPRGEVAGTLQLIELDSDEDEEEEEKEKVSLSDAALQEAVVNRPFLEVLGIAEEEAVDKTFEVTFITVSNLQENSEDKVESVPATYRIAGVVPEDVVPLFYVPFVDIRSLGVTNFSQVKVIVDNPETLAQTRQTIEAMGYVTTSVVDTVAQIESLFATARLALGLVGMIALAIAALGMFNTLTVSLLERTREVGLMKAMGMKSHEVRRLFLTESLAMGLAGGIGGLLLGLAGGKALGVGLTALALSRGGEAISVSFIPFSLMLIVLGLSVAVGIMTGFYPARRATRISALDALRYE